MNIFCFFSALTFLWQISKLTHAAPCELSADFDLKSAHIEFDEDAPINTLLFELPFQGEREEIEQITFKSNELEDLKLKDYFDVNFKSLILKSSYDLDQIETDLVELEFVCSTKTNGTFAVFRNSFLLYLTINDVNDNGPEFVNTPYKFSIKELTPIGTIVYQSIRAYDKDLPNKPNSQISFRIEKGPCSDYFEFPLTTKSDLAVSKIIHYDSFSKCLLKIVAEDHGIPQLIANTTVEIDIVDVDDKDPMFTNSYYYASIRRNSPPGTLINMASEKILAKDLDTGLNKTIVYSLNSNPDDLFIIDTRSGEIRLKHAIVDYEKTEYNLILKAAQVDNELKSALSMLNIAIIDVNEYAPVFDKSIYIVNVTENSEMDKAICQLTATDRDNNRIEYSIFNNHESPFLIEKYKGIIKVNGRLDYEMKSKYTLQVLANDGNYLANVTVIINILNLIDKAPYFESKSYNFKIKIPYDVYIGQVKVIDVENTGNMNFSLMFNNPNHSKLFCVSKTGILFLCPSIASFSNPIVQDETQFQTDEYKFNLSVSIYSSDLRKYLQNTVECYVNVEYDLNRNSNSSLQMLTQSSLGEYFDEDKTIYTLVSIIVVSFVLLIFSAALIIWLKCRKSKYKGGHHHHHHKYYKDTTNLAILASNNISSSCAMSDEAQSNSCKESTSGISSCSNKSYEKNSLEKLPQPLYYLKWEDKGIENGIMYGQFTSHVANSSCHPSIQTSNHANYALEKSSPVSKVTIMSDVERSNTSRNNPIRISSYSDILSSAASTLKNRHTPIIIRQDCLYELDKQEKTLDSSNVTNCQHVMSDATAKQNEEEKSNNKFSHITFKFTSPSNTFKKKSNPKKDPAQLSSTRLSSFLPTYHKSERNREQHSSGFVNLMFNQHEPLSVNSETNIENDSLKGERIYEDLGKLSSQEQLKANESSREDSQFKDHMSNCSNSLAKLVDMIHNTTKNRLESNTANLLNNYEEPVDSSLISTSAETYAIEPYYQEEELEMDADETSTEQQSELAETLNEDTEKSEIYQKQSNSAAEKNQELEKCSRKNSCVSKASSCSKKSMLSTITPVSSLSKLTWSTESSISLLSSSNSASIYTNRDLYINLTRKRSNESASVNSKNTISNQSASTATPSLTITTSSNSQNKLYTVVYHPNGYGSVYV